MFVLLVRGRLKLVQQGACGARLLARRSAHRPIAWTAMCRARWTMSQRDKTMATSETANRATTASARPSAGAKPLCRPWRGACAGDPATLGACGRDTPTHLPTPAGAQGYEVSALIPAGADRLPGSVGAAPGEVLNASRQAICTYMTTAALNQSRRERSTAALSGIV